MEEQMHHLLVAHLAGEFVDVISAIKQHSFSSPDFSKTCFSSDDSFKTFGDDRHGV